MFDCFLQLDGIKGETIDKDHKEEIAIHSFSWGGSQSGTMHSNTGGGAGKASFGNIHVSKNVDKSTPTLWQFMSKGSHIAKGKITVRKAGGEAREYMIITMEQILISSVSVGGSAESSDDVDETVELNFAKFQISYKPQDEKGALGAAVDFKWDIKKNVSA